MKDNSSDISESPAIKMKDNILQKGGNVKWFDPNVSGNFPLKKNNLDEALKDADVVIIPIKQDNINISAEVIANNAKKGCIVFDARRILNRDDVESKGMIYLTV